MKSKMKAMRSEVKIWRAEDLAGFLELDKAGYAGSPTWVQKVVVQREKTRQGRVYRNVEDGLGEFIRLLESKGLV